MPYIKQEDKKKFDDALEVIVDQLLCGSDDFQPGELTYVLYVIARRVAVSNPRYAYLSRVRASLQDAADEFYRRIVAPYEERKIIENGDAL